MSSLNGVTFEVFLLILVFFSGENCFEMGKVFSVRPVWAESFYQGF